MLGCGVAPTCGTIKHEKVEALRKLNSYAGAIKALGATSLYLFGSTARNKANANSDLDLFVDYDPRGRFSVLDLVAAKRLLEVGLGVEVDLTTRKGLHPLIRKQVEAEATRVF
ncbi:nucleotidyltransferase family protein [Bradyrhizobium sp.]|uniref:nucleotidyltransferase family protein n=1 Tax=Bradyrhizobium sp. TaxID=376 RepID=UPI002E071C87|nr:nucleotidyltransferase domain-containing protein [Bradyrhizobium sp.]